MLTKRSLLAGLAGAASLGTLSVAAFAQQKLAVVASFSILGDIAREIGGDRIALSTLVGPDGDAHVYSPSPRDAKVLGQASVILVNGLSFEGWMTRLIKSADARGVVATASAGVKPLKADGSHGHGAESDPHAWQDVGNGRLYAANIRDVLIAADPAGRAIYEANATAYLARLDALDAEIRTVVARIPSDRRKAITSHDALAYFAKAYGIAFIAPQGVSTEAEASARDVARIIRQIKAEKIPAVFLENVTNPRLIEQIARESGARIGGRLYSDALSSPDGPAGTYITMMRHNISQIEKALAAGPA